MTELRNNVSRPPLLVLSSADAEELTRVKLPPASGNIFNRLVRDPDVQSDRPRERACTEMLCSVLLNAPKLRSHILDWLLQLTGTEATFQFSDLDLVIETEQPIGAKRDDLRIEGWSREDWGGHEDVLEFVWTIEVKVQAGFHTSSLQDLEADEDEETLEPEVVNQLLNYDRWLTQQPARHVAGFVLSLTDLTLGLPEGLVSHWSCLSWTQLGLQIEQVLLSHELPSDERLLATHMLGFIKRYLWRESEMTNARLDFDDIALLRAYQALRGDCKSKLDRLIRPLGGLFEEYDVGVGEIKFHSRPFRGPGHVSVVRHLFFPRETPHLQIGYIGLGIVLRLESDPASERKKRILNIISTLFDDLQNRNPTWRMYSLDDAQWWDLDLKMPLVQLLTAEDQYQAVRQFAADALEDLIQSGLLNALGDALKPR